MAIRAAQKFLKLGFVESHSLRPAGFAANRSQCPTEQSPRAPLGHRGGLHDFLSPSPLRHEHFELGAFKVRVNQLVPLLETHRMILADAEALFLMRANHVADQVSK